MSSLKSIAKDSLNLKLRPISIRDIMYLEETPCNLYGIKNTLFKIVMQEDSILSKISIKKLIKSGHTNLFVKEDDYKKLITFQKNSLVNITRTLSVGSPLTNVKKHLNLITTNMKFLYNNPTDDELLKLQYQSAKNLSHFLFENYKLHPALYNEYIKQKHHFIFAQPLLSSIFLLGALRQSKLLNKKEIESLFITSYFKDIGMSIIPINKYDDSELSEIDKVALAGHAENSINILSGRIPLALKYFEIIKNHHSFSLLNSHIKTNDEDMPHFITGFETMMVNIMDIIAAMISGRPFREATSLYDALELIKVLIADQYPQEFKLLVIYFQQFFSKKT